MKLGIASKTVRILRQLTLLAASLWLAASVAEGSHRHTGENRCLQCLCLPPGRRKSDFTPIGLDFFVLRSADARRARVLERAASPIQVEQVAVLASVHDARPIGAPVLAARRFACPRARLPSFVLKTGPPRAPPKGRSSS